MLRAIYPYSLEVSRLYRQHLQAFASMAEAPSFKERPMESSVFHVGDKYKNRCRLRAAMVSC